MYSAPPMPLTSWLMPVPAGPWKPRTCFCHQAEVRRFGQTTFWEVIGDLAWAIVVQLWIKDIELRCIGTHLVFWQVWTTFVRQGAQRHVLQTVTRGTNLGVDLKTTLQLVLVELAKWTFKGEGDVFDVACATRCHRATCRQRQGGQSSNAKFLKHNPVSSYSAGLP